MVSLNDALRPYWAKGINATTVNTSVPFSKWLETGADYSIPNQITPTSFTIQTSDRSVFLKPISQDCNRFMSSAIESMVDNQKTILPEKSIGWDVIKNYYSSFYAAHFILRILGFSLTQLDSAMTNKIEKVADIYGCKNGASINNGFYLCDYSNSNSEIQLSKQNITDTGSHGALWKLVSEKLSLISNSIILNNTSPDYQLPSLKLSELVKNLRFLSINGNWLSTIRNDVNYKHLYACWFPYKNQELYFKKIKKYTSLWKVDPLLIELNNYPKENMLRFFATTNFIISLGREISIELKNRCPKGKSFTNHGALHLIKQFKLL